MRRHRVPGRVRISLPITQWSAISRARGGDDSGAIAGLRMLAVNYWHPLYLYLRKRGEDHEDASDSVQGFLSLFSAAAFSVMSIAKGVSSAPTFSDRLNSGAPGNKRAREQRSVEGISFTCRSMASSSRLNRCSCSETTAETSPEAAFDQQWAIDMIERAVDSLREGYRKRGREDWFDTLRAALPGSGQLPAYAELASQLDASDGAIKKAVFDLRHAFSECLRPTRYAYPCHWTLFKPMTSCCTSSGGDEV